MGTEAFIQKNSCDKMKGSEKINKLLEHFSLNPSEFAKRLGLKYAQNIYDIQSDKVGISKSMANKIVGAFADVNKIWLLTDEGEMLKNENANKVNGNGNTSVSGNGNKITTANITELLELQKGYQEILKTSQSQLNESQSQINRLITIIEQYNK